MYRQEIRIPNCLVGPNLNLNVIRGFANLSDLAEISRPDQYDQLENESGVQRSPTAKHAREAMEYALGSRFLDPRSNPCSFPEIILNVRDVSVLRVEKQETGSAMPFLSDDGESWGNVFAVSVEFDLSKLEMGDVPTLGPQISRVDGNHRLMQAAKLARSGEVSRNEFPLVPFALYVGLNPAQERKLFTDINANHKGMNASLITHYYASSGIGVKAESTRDQRAGWLADALSNSGGVFFAMVNKGGSLEGFKFHYKGKPPLTLIGLRNPLKSLLQTGAFWSARTNENPSLQLQWINSYFEQVRAVFPQEWESTNDYVLLKSLGLGAFGMLAGTLFNNMGDTYSREIVDDALILIRSNLNLERLKWSGYTGQSAMKVMYRKMLDSLNAAGMVELIRAVPVSK